MNLAAWTLKRLLCCGGPLLLALLIPLYANANPVDHPNSTDRETGVLVVVPDRGFLGNEEVRDAFDAFAVDQNARLLFVTDQRSEASLDRALKVLHEQGAQRIAVLPLVLSRADARWQRAHAWLEARSAQGVTMAIAPPYGASYLAVEDLSARLRKTPTDKRRLLLLGYGAGNADAATQMRRQLQRMGAFASTLAPAAIDAAVYPQRKAKDAAALRKQFNDAIGAAHGALVVPVALAPRDDSMMDFSNWLGDELPDDAQLLASPLATTAALTQWMQRATHEARLQWTPITASGVGVVALAHGADWFWNNDIKLALAPVAARHKLAYAFSMADPPVVERAVRKLEKQGAEAIVVVRAFGMASSFLPAKKTAQETVILVAHGQGEDKANQRWLDLLGSLAKQMRAEGGDAFRAIHVATWREDWPDKNKQAVIEVRAMVADAQQGGGRALIVPARINERGAADRYLKGLTFGWGRGFAQTPYFAPWFEQEIRRGLQALNATPGANERVSVPHAGH